MGKKEGVIIIYICERCGYEWQPRITDRDPRVCPYCKSPYWNSKRRNGKNAAKQKAVV